MTELCPICKQSLFSDDKIRSTRIRTYRCCNPFPANPLHYYLKTIPDTSASDILINEEFTIDLGHKVVLVTVDYVNQKTIIKNRHDQANLELNFIISPDFPELLYFKKKVATALTFS